MMRVPVVGGKNAAEIEVPETMLAASYNEPLIHQVVVAHLATARAGTKAQKSRSDVSGGGRKPWKQKGTGRARAGSIRSPLWRGGGKIFAARPRRFHPKVNRKMYRGAMRSILAELHRQGRLLVLDPAAVTLEAPKTRELVARVKELGLSDRSLLIVVDVLDERLILAARNLPTIDVTSVTSIDPVRLVRFDAVVVTVPALKKMEEYLA